ncbi:MAG: DUF2974 domain-containing protein [Blautia sp.]|nr:DUF2974 domain-containing protein [Blautia sp.]MBR2561854.1 DUF2974 domain-containing protein [Eubacterium sp.]
MANIEDYLDWRGDLTFAQDPFNEVDNLILAQLTYTDFDGAVPEPGADSVPLRDVYQRYFQLHARAEILARTNFTRLAPFLMDRLIQSARFADLRFSDYVNHISQATESQMAAVTYELSDGTKYVAFRGTDDTIVGWKEDFNLSFQNQTEGQRQAIAYLARIAARDQSPLRVGGHSKGGNFAVYAAAFSSEQIQDRILEIYSNDAPGFREEITRQEGYQRIIPKIKGFIPQDSVIGLLLTHRTRPTIIRSKGIGIMQHDAFNWEVMGRRFIHETRITDTSEFIEETLRGWLDSIGDSQRESFVNSLFQLLEASGARTLNEMGKDKINVLAEMFRTMNEMPENKQHEFFSSIGKLFQSAKQTMLQKKGSDPMNKV